MMTSRVGTGVAGVIAVDRRCNIGYSFNTHSMLVGYWRGKDLKVLPLRRGSQ